MSLDPEHRRHLTEHDDVDADVRVGELERHVCRAADGHEPRGRRRSRIGGAGQHLGKVLLQEQWSSMPGLPVKSR